ncbi:MAG: carbon-nitrogen family hydrolase [Selenomonadaceae bacterium]|nr:carbon-nitrogen family hydrolase [Selenomonadaceae bacterium]
MLVSILQFKSELGKIEKNFSTAEKLIEQAKNSDVLILPELWSTGYYPTPIENFADSHGERTKNFICGLSKKFDVNIIAGSVIVEDGGKFFNRCFVSNRQGKIISVYDKTHLFTFADEGKVFTAGKNFSVFEIDGIKCGIAICYDIRFPEFIRNLTLQGIEILFCPAAWSLKRLYPRQILTKARAIENQIFVVFVNSSGKSEIVNPCGEIISEVEPGEKILTAEINLSERKKIISEMNLLADRNTFTDKNSSSIIR